MISLTARYHEKTSDHRLTWIFQKCEERVNTKKKNKDKSNSAFFNVFCLERCLAHTNEFRFFSFIASKDFKIVGL